MIYLANGLGFSALARGALDGIKQRLEAEGFSVFEPFEEGKELGEKISALLETEKNIDTLKEDLAKINHEIGRRNASAIDKASIVLAILDGGLDLDSGVAAEIGYGAGKGKKVFGYRTDFRSAGENPGATINLQVEFFVKQSGGNILSDIDALVKALSSPPSRKQ